MCKYYLTYFISQVFLLSCNSDVSKECDYVKISQTVIDYIKKNKKEKVINLMGYYDEDFWEEGEGWDLLQSRVIKYLDTISEVKKIKYSIKIDTLAGLNYAILDFELLRTDKIFSYIQFRFAHPNSPLKCGIQSIEYVMDNSDNKIELPQYLRSSKSPLSLVF